MEKTHAELTETDERAHITVLGDGAYEKAKGLIEMSQLDKGDLGRVEVILSTQTEDPNSEDIDPEDVDSESVSLPDDFTLRDYDIHILRVFNEKSQYLTHGQAFTHSKSRYDIAKGTVGNRLRKMMRAGLLDRQKSDKSKTQYEYKITSKGVDLLESS